MATHQVRTHQGQVLMRLAHTYPNLSLSIQEMVQNAIDAGATRIHVFIDLGKRRATVQDNGEGITVGKFDEALRSVGKSVKPKVGSLGRFGLGLISPLDKVTSFSVTSQPKGSREITRWIFDPKKIEGMSDRVTIQSQKPTLLGAEDSVWKGEVTWRTVVKLSGIIKDKVTSLIDLEELHEQILAKFGHAMRNTGAVCQIVLVDAEGREQSCIIQPREYTGKSIPVCTYTEPDAGEVEFRLYRANSRNGKKQGLVSVRQQGDLFTITWKDFMNQARGTRWTAMSSAFEALSSGFFEGIISAEKIELDPARTKFVLNDALYGLYCTLDVWYREVGQHLLNDEKEQAKADRYQELGLTSLKRWDELLGLDEYAHLRAALENTFVYGRLGVGHVTPAEGTVNGPQDKPSVRTGQGGAGKPRTGEGKGGGGDRSGIPDEERDPDRPGDVPTSVIGPRGQKRKLVKHDSIGLQLSHESLDSTRLWELDANLGILYLNTTNRLWERCESKDVHLLHLTEWVIFQVLHLLILPNEQFDSAREVVDQQSKAYVELFILSSPPKRR